MLPHLPLLDKILRAKNSSIKHYIFGYNDDFLCFMHEVISRRENMFLRWHNGIISTHEEKHGRHSYGKPHTCLGDDYTQLFWASDKCPYLVVSFIAILILGLHTLSTPVLVAYLGSFALLGTCCLFSFIFSLIHVLCFGQHLLKLGIAILTRVVLLDG